MVSFRLTTDEYTHLSQLCLTRGLRSVSELLRTALNHLIETTPPSHEIQTRVETLESQLADLSTTVAHLQTHLPANQATNGN
jgi:chaperonin cofactor prefoldin